jgi:hypothetical protein
MERFKHSDEEEPDISTTRILSNRRFQQQGHLVTDGNTIFSNMLGICNTEESNVLARFLSVAGTSGSSVTGI